MAKLMEANKLDYRIDGSRAYYHVNRQNGIYTFSNLDALSQFEAPSKGSKLGTMLNLGMVSKKSVKAYIHAMQLRDARIQGGKNLSRFKLRARFTVGLKLKGQERYVPVVFTEELIYSKELGMYAESVGYAEVNYSVKEGYVAEVDFVAA